MKKLYTILLLLSFLFLNKESKAQWVAIPDTNFRNFLTTNYPTAMSGSMMDTTNGVVLGAKTIDCGYSHITDLNGIQYFDSLETLICTFNSLNTLPILPNSLTNLDCSWNTHLTILPILPNNLQYLNCFLDSLVNLPSLPNSLLNLECSNNKLLTLPNLPIALEQLGCSYNQLTTLSALLPSSLRQLICSNNQLTTLPNILPVSLRTIGCSNNQITTLPILPSKLIQLYCENNLLVALPTLPDSLRWLQCSNNLLTSLPSNLSDSLIGIICDSNLISSLPILPFSLHQLICDKNPNLHCLPDLKNVESLTFDTNNILCIPNRGSLDTSWLSYPVCAAGNPNNCQLYCNSYYSTIYNTPLNTFILTVDTAASNLALSYHWDFGDGTTSTLAAPSHVYTVDTVYTVCLQIHNIAGDSCTYCDTIGKDYLGNIIIKSGGFSLNVHNGATGINQLKVESEKIKIYPNPASDKITISKEQISINTIQIYDVLGREQDISIVNQKSKIVNVSSLPNGIYFVKVSDAAGNYGMKKLVVER